jgi:octaprenyl-diphosphate synthase
MPNNLNKIQVLLEQELDKLKTTLKNSLSYTHDPLKEFITYILQTPGKQLRTRLVFLIAGAHGAITQQTQRGAALVSLMHQASLLHDDVIDEANQRRGRHSVNAIWGNKQAILIGNYLLYQCISLTLKYQDYIFLNQLTNAAQAMIDGELLQLKAVDPLAVTAELCLTIMHKKTASLMAACCAIGAMSSGQATDKQVKLMYQLGEVLGMAFQIQDDLLDYHLEADLDKAINMDIQSGKITLPLVYALQQANDQLRKDILALISRCKQEPTVIPTIVHFVYSQNGIKLAREKMYFYQAKALKLATKHLSESAYKTILVRLLSETIV